MTRAYHATALGRIVTFLRVDSVPRHWHAIGRQQHRRDFQKGLRGHIGVGGFEKGRLCGRTVTLGVGL